MNLFEATAKLTLDTGAYETTLKKVLSGATNIQNFFSGIGNSSDSAGKQVSIFGDVLKANLLSDTISKGFETIVNGFESIGNAAAGFIKDSVSAGMNFDSAMSQVAATMGTSVDEIQNLRDFAKEMGATTKYSATEAADGLNILAQAGLSAEEQISGLPTVLNMASAGSLSLETSASYVTAAVKGFQDEMENAQYYSDLIAKGATLANTSVSALGDAFSGTAATAKNYGQTAESMEVALLRLAEQNVVGSEATTALSRVMMDLFTPTEEAKNALSELGVVAYDEATGKARDLNEIISDLNNSLSEYSDEQRLAYESTIFSSYGMKAFDKIATTSTEKMQKFYDGLAHASDGIGAAAEQAKTQINNLAGAKTILASAIEGLQINISDALKPMLTAFVQFAAESAQSLTDTLSKNGISGIRKVIAKIIKNGSRTLKNNIPEFVKGVSRVIKAITGGIADGLPDIADAAREIIEKISTTIKVNLPTMIKNGTKIVSNFKKGIADNLSVLIPAATDAILTIIDEITKPESITDFIDSGITLITALAEGLSGSVSVLIDKVPDIIENLKQGFEDNKDKIKSAAVSLLKSLGTYMVNVKRILKSKAPKIMAKIRDELKNAVPKMTSVANKIISAIAKAFDASDKWQDIKDTFAVITDGIPETVSKDGKILKTTLSESFDRIKKSVKNLTDNFQPMIDKFKEWIESGQSAYDANSFVKAIIDAFTAIASISIDAVSRLISKIIDFGTWLTGASAGAESFRTAIVGIVTAIGTFAGVLTIMAAVQKFGAFLQFGLPVMIANLPNLLAGVSGAFSGLFGVIAANPIVALIAVLAGLAAALVYVMNTSEEWQIGWEMIKDTWNEFIDNIITGWGVYKEIIQKLKNKWNNFKDSFAVGVDVIVTGWNNFKDSLTLGWETYKEIIRKMKNRWNNFIDSISEGYITYEETFNNITSKVEEFGESWKEFWEGYGEYLADGIADFKEKIQDIPDKFIEIVDDAKNWGSDMLLNFLDGVNSEINPLYDTFEGLGEWIYDRFHHSTPEKGYLKDDDTWFPDMLKLFSRGMKQNAYLVENQAESLAGNLADTFQNPLVIGTELNKLESPELSDTSYEVKFIDNLDNIIEKVRNLTDKTLHVNAETEYNTSQGNGKYLRNLSEINAVTTPYNNDYIKKIDRIRDSYSTVNNYYHTSNNSYETNRNNNSQSGYTATNIQTMNISVPGINIHSETDMEALADALIDKIAEKLEAKAVYDNRGYGGVGF